MGADHIAPPTGSPTSSNCPKPLALTLCCATPSAPERHGYAPQPDYRPLTKFENRGLKLGHGVWDLVFKRI
jgi:hypothetical protein